MPFNIYPDPQTAPLPLLAGAGMPLPLAMAANTGPDPDAFGLTTSFIRISMSGAAAAAPPQVGLTAVHPSLTQGAEVNITAITLGTAQALLDGTNVTDAASAYFFPPHSNNVYLLKVVINIAGTTLKIRITNNTAVNRDFVWVVADSNANSQQPWINATPATLAYNALINQATSLTTLTVSVLNRGTGSLTVSSFTPALPADYTATGLPATVIPNASADISIVFHAPVAPADLPAALFRLDGDLSLVFGAGHNREVTLSAKTQALELALLLDDSGSMSWQPDGDPIPPAAPPSRWSLAASAANAFLDLLAVFGRNNVTNQSMGTFGVARFPAPNPVNPSSFDLIAPISIPMSMGAHQTTISNNLPFFAGTPMGDAINRVLTPGANYFSTVPQLISLNRRWIILMTDGAENSSTINSLTFVPPLAPAGQSLNDKKIKLYGVGFGVLGQEEVNFGLIDTLAAGSFEGGVPTNMVDSSNIPAPTLAAALRTAIKSGLVSASSPTDPGGTLTSASPEARHRVIITPYDTKIAFVLNWSTENAKRMRLHLLTPTCDLITPESAGPIDSGELGFSGASRYQIYRIEDSFLRNKANPANPRYGNWTMVVFSDQLGPPNAGASEYYEYDIIVESRLRMDLTLNRARYYAGDPIGISATLTVDGKPIKQAAVSLSLKAPGQAVGNWLAGIKITAEEFRSAEKRVLELTKKDTNALFIKAFAAKTKKIVFDKSTSTSTIPMTDPGNQGVYSATVTQTATPDKYSLYVTAVGTTEDGVVFRREGKVDVRVGVRPDPAFSLIDIKYSRVLVNDRPFLTATMFITPRDRFGNVLLVDPATDNTIVLSSKNAEFSGPLTASHDGTYTRTLQYATDVVPAFDLAVAGEKLVPTRTVTPVTKLVYVDQVVDFKAGAEAAKEANRHRNPRDVLGNVLTKKADVFLSLGAYGALTVSVKGQFILAQGNEDVTVFVLADEDRRTYSVEALPTGETQKWVMLGEAAGTQSFSLRKAKLKSAIAIRITDLSGRIRDVEFKPSATPGVSIVGVGVRQIGNASGAGTLDKAVGAVVGGLADGTEYRQVLTNPAEGEHYTGPDGRKWIAVHEVIVAGKVIKDPFTLLWRLER